MIEESNYPDAAPMQYAGGAKMVGHARRLDITMRQNIDERIKRAQAVVKELEETKARLEKSGLLDTRIDDIQRAMRF
jgi:uncharacterized protein YjgD (DUF1641 family)